LMAWCMRGNLSSGYGWTVTLQCYASLRKIADTIKQSLSFQICWWN